jgi:GH15 family glucan-1,4-alpha-glucosidase
MSGHERDRRDETPPAIGDYGIIGDGRTAALCSIDGSIDWLCAPRFDSEPIFGRLIDPTAGGTFSIRPDGVKAVSRRYRDGSAVLETEWQTDTGSVRLTEGMVLDVSSSLMPQLLLVRRLRSEGGTVPVRVLFGPRRGLPGTPPRVDARGTSLRCAWGALVVAFRTEPSLPIEPGREHRFHLDGSRDVTFILSVSDREPVVDVAGDVARTALESSDRWWRAWSDGISYEGPERSFVVRSLVTLRLLTYPPSGAPVAAPTTSLPEVVGGSRNWDYRYAWPRDASLGITSFLAVGKPEEAHSFLHWLLHASRLSRPRVDVLYTLDGRPGPEEIELSVEGYRASRPVRVGNAASHQHQLDVYGWVVDAAARFARAQGSVHGATLRAMAGFADYVADHHGEPDSGIWESRETPQHHVHSKVMAWAALDRALELRNGTRGRHARLRRWTAARDVLARQIPAEGFDVDRGAYVRTYGGHELDSSLLSLPGLGFDREHPERLLGTVEAVRRELSAGGPLLYRYPPDTDGMEGTEGAFLPCSFWMVEALATLGHLDEAQAVFDDLCGRSTELGLFAEEMDPSTGGHIGTSRRR